MSKAKRLQENHYRVIKIDKDALCEFIYESIIDNEERFFDLREDADITSHHNINLETGEYICLIRNTNDTLKLPDGINMDLLLANMKKTTDTLYAEKRYVELTIDDIKEIQAKEKE